MNCLSYFFSEDCQDWVRKTTTALVQLHCFGDSYNIYSELPNISSLSLDRNDGLESSNNVLDEDVNLLFLSVTAFVTSTFYMTFFLGSSV